MSEKVKIKIARNVVHLPAIALRGLVVFPGNVIHFEVGRKKSIAAVEWAISNNNALFLTAQQDIDTEDPTFKDLSHYGVVAEVKQVLRVSNELVKVLDYLEGDEAGIKSASILVEGHNAYGFLRSENGVHRLVRVSPFDASGRRHTSFASLEVMPELDDAITVEIKPEDIKMEVFRSSGAGGQHINKTSSAVRLIHIPTGIVVSCQNERSQFQNRDMCMKMLAAKLYQIKEREHLDKISDIKGVQNAIAWGSQIRSYVFMPYTLVKDHRTGFENGNVNGVMDGDLDGFINAYLKMSSKGEL